MLEQLKIPSMQIRTAIPLVNSRKQNISQALSLGVLIEAIGKRIGAN